MKPSGVLCAALVALSICHPALASTLQPDRQFVSAAAVTTAAFVLTPAESEVEYSFPVDRAGRVHLTLVSTAAGLDATLISPDRGRIAIGSARPGIQSSIDVVDGLGAVYRAILSDPAPGTWRLQIKAKQVSSRIDLNLRVQFGNDVAAIMLPDAEEVRAGGQATLSLAVVAGTDRVRALSLEAVVVNPSGMRSFATFRDDGRDGDSVAGDGMYIARVPMPVAGEYRVVTKASGWTLRGEFERTSAVTLRAVNAGASLVGTFADTAADSDGDSRPDTVIIAPAVSVQQSGTYRASVRLRAASGAMISAAGVADLQAGTTSVPIPFTIDALESGLGQDGPYTVESLYLEREAADGVEFSDRLDGIVGTTSAYSLSSLRPVRVRISDTISAVPFDSNGDGRADLLRVTTEFETPLGGSYDVSALLSHGTSVISPLADHLMITAIQGRNGATFDFDGASLAASGVDGPYEIGLSIDGPTASLGTARTLSLPPFDASIFGDVSRDTLAPALNVSVTPAILWPPDRRMVEIVPTIRVTDDHDPNPLVRLESIETSPSEGEAEDSGGGDIQLDGGRIFLRARRAGNAGDRTYTLVWVAQDASGNAIRTEVRVLVPHDQASVPPR